MSGRRVFPITSITDDGTPTRHEPCLVTMCSPSRASLMTGRRPDTNHVWEIAADEYWRDYTNATSIPQYFKENGFISVGMGKLYHPGPLSGHDDTAYSWSPGLPYFHSRKNGNKTVSWFSFDEEHKTSQTSIVQLYVVQYNIVL